MVTREQFMSYFDVQMGSDIDLNDDICMKLSGLNKETYFNIIKNYNKYYNKFFGYTNKKKNYATTA